MSFFNSYSPDRVVIAFQGVNIVGFAEGTFVEVEREEDEFTKKVGSLGDVTRVHNLNRSGKITITLMQGSPINDLLAGIQIDDGESATGVGSLLIKDLSGSMLCHAANTWIMKHPKIELGKEAGNVVWVFECADIDVFAGGNVI